MVLPFSKPVMKISPVLNLFQASNLWFSVYFIVDSGLERSWFRSRPPTWSPFLNINCTIFCTLIASHIHSLRVHTLWVEFLGPILEFCLPQSGSKSSAAFSFFEIIWLFYEPLHFQNYFKNNLSFSIKKKKTDGLTLLHCFNLLINLERIYFLRILSLPVHKLCISIS